LNRLVEKTPDLLLGEPSITFAYNLLGQRTNMVDASGVTTYRFSSTQGVFRGGRWSYWESYCLAKCTCELGSLSERMG